MVDRCALCRGDARSTRRLSQLLTALSHVHYLGRDDHLDDGDYGPRDGCDHLCPTSRRGLSYQTFANRDSNLTWLQRSRRVAVQRTAQRMERVACHRFAVCEQAQTLPPRARLNDLHVDALVTLGNFICLCKNIISRRFSDFVFNSTLLDCFNCIFTFISKRNPKRQR